MSRKVYQSTSDVRTFIAQLNAPQILESLRLFRNSTRLFLLALADIFEWRFLGTEIEYTLWAICQIEVSLFWFRLCAFILRFSIRKQLFYANAGRKECDVSARWRKREIDPLELVNGINRRMKWKSWRPCAAVWKLNNQLSSAPFLRPICRNCYRCGSWSDSSGRAHLFKNEKCSALPIHALFFVYLVLKISLWEKNSSKHSDRMPFASLVSTYTKRIGE